MIMLFMIIIIPQIKVNAVHGEQTVSLKMYMEIIPTKTCFDIDGQ